MYFFDIDGVDICTKDYLAVWQFVGLVINIIKIGVPIILIILGMIDLTKAVASKDEEQQKKATKLLGKRFLYAVGVFASFWIVTTILDIVSENAGEAMKYNEASWKKCWNLINKKSSDDTDSSSSPTYCYLCGAKNYVWEPSGQVIKSGPMGCVPVESTGEKDCLNKNESDKK